MGEHTAGIAWERDDPRERAEELVVLLGEDRQPVGTLPKRLVHHHDTPLHLAFSCYVFDPAGRLLVTRRALGKQAWPGVWTNTCCGHPGPGEPGEDAVRRRLDEELGLRVGALEVALPDFAYRAVDPGGIVENEVCPVYVTRVGESPTFAPSADEVAEWRWVGWDDVLAVAERSPWLLSPWAALQVPALAELGLADLVGTPG